MNEILINKNERKLNIKKLIAAIIICIVLIVVVINCVNYSINVNKISQATDKYYTEMEEKKRAEIKRIEEEKAIEEKKKLERYKPLSEKEIESIKNIYDHSEPKRVFLTFDDGPSESVTPFILDLLKKENIKATFFVLGNMVETFPEIVKREYDEGHFIGNHGVSHRYSEIYENTETVVDEYNNANESIKKAVGNPDYNSLVFRFPGGSNGGYYHEIKQEAKEELEKQGVASLDWNALTNDSAGATTTEEIMENFHNTVDDKTSIVILMHDASDKVLTYEALPEIIEYFKENEYVFKSLFDLFER